MAMYQHLSPDYQEKVFKRWEKVIKAGNPIRSESAALATALVLENTQREFQKSSGGMITEANIGMGAGAGAATAPYGTDTGARPAGGNALGSNFNYGVNDSRIPTIVIPTLRRIFPELIAHDVIGVQPMNGPVGFAYALRFQYGANGKGMAAGTPIQGNEIGYNNMYSDFTGASGLTEENRTANYAGGSNVVGAGTVARTSDAYWQAFAGATDGRFNGLGASMGDAEWWAIGSDMPMSQFKLEKGVVEAKTRKLAAHWSLELAEDMMNMHGLDVDAEMVNVMSYEIQAEIDRQCVAEMVKAAIAGGRVSTWSPVSADGRHQLERIGTLYTQILIKAQEIGINTRRGPGNFMIASPTIVALTERLSDFELDKAGDAKVQYADMGVAFCGTLRRGNLRTYRDTFAGGNYILVGYKGPTPYDSGIIYCPYIPVQLNRAVGVDDFSPRIGVRTRYGVLDNLYGSGNYYQFIKVDGLTSAGLVADSTDQRVFLY